MSLGALIQPPTLDQGISPSEPPFFLSKIEIIVYPHEDATVLHTLITKEMFTGLLNTSGYSCVYLTLIH